MCTKMSSSVCRSRVSSRNGQPRARARAETRGANLPHLVASTRSGKIAFRRQDPVMLNLRHFFPGLVQGLLRCL